MYHPQCAIPNVPFSLCHVQCTLRGFTKDRLYALFAEFGHILRFKLVPSDDPEQSGYGLVQFTNRNDAHQAINSFILFIYHSLISLCSAVIPPVMK